MCRNYKSESRWIYGSNCLFRLADGEEMPSKRSKKESAQGAVAFLKQRKVQGCVSQNSDPKKSILRKAGQLKENASVVLSKKVTLMSEILARLSLKKEHLRRPHDKKIAPAKQRGICREQHTSSKPIIKLRFILLWTKWRRG